jgi:hypothetical protein
MASARCWSESVRFLPSLTAEATSALNAAFQDITFLGRFDAARPVGDVLVEIAHSHAEEFHVDCGIGSLNFNIPPVPALTPDRCDFCVHLP